MWMFLMKLLGFVALAGLGLLGFGVLYELLTIWLENIGRRVNPEQPEPQPIEQMAIGGSLYLRQGDKILDVGRALVMGMQGLLTEPNPSLLTWEGKRRIVHDSPKISMRVVQEALGSNDGPLPPMLPGQDSGNFMPVLQEWSVKDE